MSERTAPQRIGPYRILQEIGRGGMGTVYAAHDERLHRQVALKVITQLADDEHARERLWREARAAARVNHPNICQLHEIGEDGATLYLVMELLQGESLADQISRGPLPQRDAAEAILNVLTALEALHAAGIVHGDLKPANVFLAAHGVKLVDFGLARAGPSSAMAIEASETKETLYRTGSFIGTPGYMSPERLRGVAADIAGDIFAAGALLFEMISGRRAFRGDTLIDVFHATAFEEPPSVGAVRLDAVVRRALAKDPGERFSSAASMAKALTDAVAGDAGPVERPIAAARQWLIVLPFRARRGDDDSEFLAFGLADAIAGSLAGLQSLGVRSSAAAARFAGDAPDLVRLAAEAGVDIVLTGALIRAGQWIRVNTQLVEVPAGSLLWSHTAQVSVKDVFQVQDEIVQRIVASLPLPLNAVDRARLRRDVPANAAAYEFYLRANQVALQSSLGTLEQNQLARGLYLQSLQEDPSYAPAWARLARCERVIGKTGVDVDRHYVAAEEALQRALSLNSELPIAHTVYAYLETDLGRSADALRRLTAAAAAHVNDPEVFAALVLVCRYCGLLDASVGAYTRARQLDPHVTTSVRHTYWALGDAGRALSVTRRFYFEAMVLATTNRTGEALDLLNETLHVERPETMRLFLGSLRATLEGKAADAIAATERCLTLFRDPEARFYLVRQLAYLGQHERSIAELVRVVDDGYLVSKAIAIDPWFDALRSHPRFVALADRSAEREAVMEEVLRRSGVQRLLSLAPE